MLAKTVGEIPDLERGWYRQYKEQREGLHISLYFSMQMSYIFFFSCSLLNYKAFFLLQISCKTNFSFQISLNCSFKWNSQKVREVRITGKKTEKESYRKRELLSEQASQIAEEKKGNISDYR